MKNYIYCRIIFSELNWGLKVYLKLLPCFEPVLMTFSKVRYRALYTEFLILEFRGPHFARNGSPVISIRLSLRVQRPISTKARKGALKNLLLQAIYYCNKDRFIFLLFVLLMAVLEDKRYIDYVSFEYDSSSVPT